MGNSNGDIWAYWRPIYNGAKFLQGGFIWDWVDQSLRTPVPASRKIEELENPRAIPVDSKLGTFFSYGGTFGPPGVTSDGNFCANGLINADRVPHPGLAEVKKVYQPIQMRAGDLARGEVEIKNWSCFLSSEDWLVADWRVVADGGVLESGRLDGLVIPPGEHKIISVPLHAITPSPGTEYFLEISFKLKVGTLWAGAGHEVAWEQFKLPWYTAAAASESKLPALKLENVPTSNRIVASNAGFSAAFDRKSGLLVSLKSGNSELLAAPLRPDFWRAPVDNDRGNRMAGPPDEHGQGLILSRWRKAHETWQLRSVDVQQPSPGRVIVTVEGIISEFSAPYRLKWTVLASGEVLVEAMLNAGAEPMPELPRFGMQTTLGAGFEHLVWFGKGPQETYWDRQDARVGLYRSTVSAQYFDYIKPQETGNHEGVRWLAVTDARGRGLLAVGDPLLSANALHYSTDDLFCQTQKEDFYRYLLPERDTITLNLDWHQRGLGGDNSWGNLPHDEFRMMKPPFSYRYRLHVLHGGEDCVGLAKRAFD
jgi:beta-galactosidase